MPQPVTVFVEDGKIVRLGFSYGVSPDVLLSAIPVENILITPGEAGKIMEQVLHLLQSTPVNP